jgi:hypothetical protein
VNALVLLLEHDGAKLVAELTTNSSAPLIHLTGSLPTGNPYITQVLAVDKNFQR